MNEEGANLRSGSESEEPTTAVEAESVGDLIRSAVPALIVLQWLMTAFQGGTGLVPAYAMHVFLLLALLGTLFQGAEAVSRGIAVLLGLGALLCFGSAAFSPATGPALQQLSGFLVLLIIVWGVVSAPRFASLQWPVAIGAGCVHAAWAIVGAFRGDQPRASSSFLSALDLGCFLVPLLVESLARASRNHARFRAMYLIAAILMGVGILLSGSRIAVIALALSPWPLLVPHMRRRRVAWMSLALILVLASAGVLWRRTVSPDPYAYSRFYIWRDSLVVAAEHPLGTGLGAYSNAMRMQGVRLPGLVSYPKDAGSAHNEWIQDLVELGWIGGLYMLAFTFLAGRALLHPDSDPDRRARLISLGIALGVPSLAHITLHEQPLAILAALWFGEVLGGAYRQKGVVAGRRSIHLATWISLAALLPALPGVLSQATIQLADLSYRRGNLQRALDRADLASRLAPFAPEPILLRERLRYVLGGDPIKISETLESASTRFPYSVDLPLTAASMIDAALGAEDDARMRRHSAQLLAMAAERDPKRALGWVAVGKAWLLALDSPAAGKAIVRALELEASCAQAHALAAVLAKRKGDLPAAREHAEKARRFDEMKGAYDGYARDVLSLDPFTRRLLAEARL